MVKRLIILGLFIAMLSGCRVENPSNGSSMTIEKYNIEPTRQLSNLSTIKVGDTIDVNYSVKYSAEISSVSQQIIDEQLVAEKLRPFLIEKSDLQNLKLNSAFYFSENGKAAKGLLSFIDSNMQNDIINGYSKPLSIADLNANKNLWQFENGAKTGPFISAVESFLSQSSDDTVIIPVVDSVTKGNNMKFIKFAKFTLTVQGKDNKGNGNKEVVGIYKGEVSNPPLVIKDMSFTEVFPKNIDVVNVSVPTANKEGNKDIGTTVSATLGDIVFHKNDQGLYTASGDISFSITIKSTKWAVYELNNSKIEFADLTDKWQTEKFNNLTFTAKDGLKSVTVTNPVMMNIDETKQVSIQFDPADAIQQNVITNMCLEGNADFINISPKLFECGTSTTSQVTNNFTISPKIANSGNLILKVADIFGTVQQVPLNVTVYNRIRTIALAPSSLTMDEGMRQYLTLSITPQSARDHLQWEVLNEPGKTVVQFNEDNLEVAAMQAGDATIRVTGTRVDGSTFTQNIPVTVRPSIIPLQSITFSSNSITIVKGERKGLSGYVRFTPINATNKAVMFTETAPSAVIDVTSWGEVTGKMPGRASVTATSADGSHKATIEIIVEEKGSNGIVLPDLGGGGPVLRW